MLLAVGELGAGLEEVVDQLAVAGQRVARVGVAVVVALEDARVAVPAEQDTPVLRQLIAFHNRPQNRGESNK